MEGHIILPYDYEYVVPVWMWSMMLLCVLVGIQFVDPLFVLLVFGLWCAGADVAELTWLTFKMQEMTFVENDGYLRT